MILVSWLVYAILNPRVIRAVVLLPLASLAAFFIPPEVYSVSLNRALTVFNVLLGVTNDESFNARFAENAINLAPMQDSVSGILFGIGHNIQATDSDYISFLLHYGLIFLLAFYGLIAYATVAIRPTFQMRTTGQRLRLFLAMTTLDKFLEGVLQGGTIAPGVAGYYFAFLGAALAMYAGRTHDAEAPAGLPSVAETPS